MNNAARSVKHTKFFVGSTYEDLKEHRVKCISVMGRLRNEFGIDCIAMENFGADDRSPKERCLDGVRDADVYIGIFGMCYGYIDEESGKSITELEYDEAQRIKLPLLIYLI